MVANRRHFAPRQEALPKVWQSTYCHGQATQRIQHGHPESEVRVREIRACLLTGPDQGDVHSETHPRETGQFLHQDENQWEESR